MTSSFGYRGCWLDQWHLQQRWHHLVGVNSYRGKSKLWLTFFLYKPCGKQFLHHSMIFSERKLNRDVLGGRGQMEGQQLLKVGSHSWRQHLASLLRLYVHFLFFLIYPDFLVKGRKLMVIHSLTGPCFSQL